jgi:hypothetical protein
MPRQEAGRAVDRVRLLNMGYDQIIVSALCACGDGSRSPRW